VTGYLAICSRAPGNELIAAECENLTGARPEADGVATCERIDRIPRAAFVHSGLRLLARAGSLEALAADIARQDLAAEDFRVELWRGAGGLPVDRQKAILALADALRGFPNLDAPRHRFTLLARRDELYFGEVMTECAHDYRRHMGKPYHTSSSLPAQLARGLVNLVWPRADSILDPCCGTGSILLEAQALGLQALGCDRNPRMVGMTRKNLAYFGYAGETWRMDARECRAFAAAVVTDLPYGRFTVLEQDNVRAILANCARLAPVGVFAAGAVITPWLAEAGYTGVEVLRVQKSGKFSRYIHRARSSCYA
jgi:predicted RNA methylase